MRKLLQAISSAYAEWDEERRGVVRSIKLLADEGRSMVLVTHDMALARSIADRVIFLHGGLIEEEGTPDEVFGATRSTRLQQFLSAGHA